MTLRIDVTIPEGKAGNWKIENFEIDKDGAALHNLRCVLTGNPTRAVLPGKYTRLMHNGMTIMSNTPAEIYDHIDFFRMARIRGGDILINGLGLGMAVTYLLTFDKVESITIIEIDKDVISLVAPSFEDNPRVNIINADAYTYTPVKGKRFSVVWHDIWPDICSDNLPEMHKLHRKYGKRCDWQGSWARDLCEHQKKLTEQGRW